MKRFLWTGLALTAGALIAVAARIGVVEAQADQRAPWVQTANAPAAGDLEVIQVRPNFFMIAGAGGNIDWPRPISPLPLFAWQDAQ